MAPQRSPRLGSDYIAVYELFRYGGATKTDSRVSVASKPHDRGRKPHAQDALRYPPVEINGHQALAVATGFRTALEQAGYQIHACAILPDHVHLVIGAHPRNIRTIVGHLRSMATRELKKQQLWHADERPVWGGHGWNVWLEDLAAVMRAIRYVENNPIKEGKRRQSWHFVTPFDLQSAMRVAREVARAGVRKRRIGGAALRSHEEKVARERGAAPARRERRG